MLTGIFDVIVKSISFRLLNYFCRFRLFVNIRSVIIFVNFWIVIEFTGFFITTIINLKTRYFRLSSSLFRFGSYGGVFGLLCRGFFFYFLCNFFLIFFNSLRRLFCIRFINGVTYFGTIKFII